jgi:hypothetical protein
LPGRAPLDNQGASPDDLRLGVLADVAAINPQMGPPRWGLPVSVFYASGGGQ